MIPKTQDALKLSSLVAPLQKAARGEIGEVAELAGDLRTWAGDLLEFVEAGRFYAEVFASSRDAIMTRDLDGRITTWNAAAERLFGYTAEEAVGHHIKFLSPPEKHAEVDAAITASLRGEVVAWFDTERLRKDGSLVQVSLTGSPVFSPAGELIGMSTIVRDMGEHRQAEERFRRAVEASPNGMIMIDEAGEIVLVNSEIERMFGYSRDELLGQQIDVLVPERFQHGHTDLRASYVRDPQTRRMGEGRDLYGLRKDGTEFAVEIGLNPLRQSNGLAVLASVVDIHDRRQAEARFRLAVEASPNGMIMVDEKGEIVLVNSEIERMFGYSRNELLGKPVDILVSERLRSGHAELRANYVRDPQARRMGEGRDLYGLRKDGAEIAIEIGLNPLRQPDGIVVLASVVDIRERKAAQEALERRQLELERSNADLEQFAYAASHDLREPLRMVASYTELLAKRYGGQIDERADKYIRYATEGAQRMQDLIEDLLAFSRAGSAEAPAATVNVEEVLDSALSNLRATIVETGATIEHDALPEVVGHRAQFLQVLQNLIGNALKFRAEHRKPVIRVSARREGSNWLFSVADNGIGIEAQYAERVFQMFQRLNERSAYPGTGIGLAITKRVVESNGGTIWFESEPDVGTTFYFTLPVYPERKVVT